jgi:hypothetical protein
MEKLLLLFLKKDVFVSKKQAEESIGTADSPPPLLPARPCSVQQVLCNTKYSPVAAGPRDV